MNTLKRLARAKRKAKFNRITRAHKARGADVEFNGGDFLKVKPHKWVASRLFDSYKNETMSIVDAPWGSIDITDLAVQAFNSLPTSEPSEGVS